MVGSPGGTHGVEKVGGGGVTSWVEVWGLKTFITELISMHPVSTSDFFFLG